jgi:DNA polymerase-3 subunit alpha (Gram-positive type)
LDELGHDDPTILKYLEDMTGVDVKSIPMNDENILSLFASGDALAFDSEESDYYDLGSLGLSEVGTALTMQMLRDTKPTSFSDMVRISGLSHGTNVWNNNTKDLIAQGKCDLSTAICTRDDIMTYLIGMGLENGKAFEIMESVRKGRGLTEQQESDMLAVGVPDWYIWSCKRIKYMFPKAHAVAYITMMLRIAYFKVYYPLEYYSVYFTIRAKAFDYDMMCAGKEVLQRNMDAFMDRQASHDYEQRLSAQEKTCLENMKIVMEMYSRNYEFLPLDLYESDAMKFKIQDGKLRPPLVSLKGLGEVVCMQIAARCQKTEFQTIEDFSRLCGVNTTATAKLKEMGLFGDMRETNQISLW